MTQQTQAAHHALPHDQFTALARGGGAEAIGRLVAGQHSKHLILVSAVAGQARGGDGPDDEMATAGYELLAQVQAKAPAAAEEVTSYPSVGAWALHTLRGRGAVPDARPGRLASVAAAAAVKAGLDAEIEVPVVNGTVQLPALGTATVAGPTAVVRTKAAEIYSGGTCVRLRPGAPGWEELVPVRAGELAAVLDDLDVFRMPANDGEPTGRLAPAQAAEFVTSVRAAWTVLSADRASEVAAIVRVIVPYKAPEAGLVSTSSPQAFGTVAMSRQPDKYTCAETLVHETQHLKLCALLDLVPLTKPDDGQRYYAPWRPDPRPASGLLQGAYAFLGVSGYWREQRQAPEAPVRDRAQADFARWRDGAALVAETLLGSGQLTDAGQDFVRAMAEVLDEWRREPVSRGALLTAQQKADRHRAQWQADNE